MHTNLHPTATIEILRYWRHCLWIAALLGQTKLLPTAQIALQTMLVSQGIYLSGKLGRAVSAQEVHEHSVSSAVPV